MKIIFKNDEGLDLAANLELPVEKPVAYALFAHCFTCSKDTLAAFRISKALTAFGIAVLRFDFTGLGNSEGDFANTNFSSNVSDLLSAARYLKENYAAPSLLIGHSFGGAAVLAAASQLEEIKAVVTIAAPADLTHLKSLFTDKIDEIKEKGEAAVTLAGREFHIKQQFFEDLDQGRLPQVIAALQKAILVFHSPQDTVVNIEHGYKIFSSATSSKSFISLDGADHLLMRASDAAYVAQLIKDWVARYITFADESIKADLSAQVIVRETKQGKLTQEIITGQHVLMADEPVKFGGNDAGPGPYDLVLAGLGACTSMTIRMYADFKKIPLDRVIVKLNHNKVHAEDCVNCEDDKAKIDHIERLIELQGKLTEEEREKLLAIANKCPVHRTLTSKISIATKLI